MNKMDDVCEEKLTPYLRNHGIKSGLSQFWRFYEVMRPEHTKYYELPLDVCVT